MRSQAANMFAKYLDSKDLKYDILSEEENVIALGWMLKNSKITVFFKFDDENTNVNLEGMGFITVPNEKLEQMYKVCNEVNKKYRWVKFFVEEDHNTICALDDAVIQLDSAANEVFELMIRMVGVVDDAYPTFMKALWA